MTTVSLQFDVSAELLAQLDALRGAETRGEFALHCLALGLMDIQEEAHRVTRDFLYQSTINRTEYFKAYRDMRRLTIKPVDEPNAERVTLPRKP